MREYLSELQNSLIKLNKQSWAMVNMCRESADGMSQSLFDEPAGDWEITNLKLAKNTIGSLARLFGRL